MGNPKNIMRWKADIVDQIHRAMGHKQDMLKKLYQRTIDGPSFPKMSRSYADPLVEFYKNRGARSSSDQQQ